MTRPKLFSLTVVERLLQEVDLVDYRNLPPSLSADYQQKMVDANMGDFYTNQQRMIANLERLAAGLMMQHAGIDPEGTEAERRKAMLRSDIILHRLAEFPEKEADAIVDRINRAIAHAHNGKEEIMNPAETLKRAYLSNRKTSVLFNSVKNRDGVVEALDLDGSHVTDIGESGRFEISGEANLAILRKHHVIEAPLAACEPVEAGRSRGGNGSGWKL